MPFLAALRAFLLAILLGTLGAALFVALRPEGGPRFFGPLALAEPVDFLTHARLVALEADPAACRALLTTAGIAFRALPRGPGNPACAVEDGVVLRPPGAAGIGLFPARPTLACPLAAALLIWEREVVQPAATRILGSRVVGIDHLGSFACRRRYGRADAAWSEHARARAIDIAGFRLADGRRVVVASDWGRGDDRAAFLHAVRDGACRIVSTTLSPDYNAAHRDHVHLDLAPGFGGFCR